MGKRRKSYEKVLQKYFGYEHLKDQQFRIIDRIVQAQKDVLAILATGFGKSMCYQLPHLITQKCVFVVSPLLALMQDQHEELKERGIASCCLNSHNTDKKSDYRRLYDGEPMIVFSTPEYLTHCEQLITDLHDEDLICCFAIDESHCISSWSDQSFRPEYKDLKCLRRWAPQVPILALTATASSKVQQDIVKYLKMDKFRTVKSSFDRPNLYLSIHHKSGTKQRRFDLAPLMRKFRDQSVIIYARKRKETEQIAQELTQMGFPCLAYHAGMEKSTRNQIQQRFMEGEVNCICATIAFGMGINNKHIRLVVHYGCPSNLESYYQEIGRAGRDGERSECHLFYNDADFQLSRHFLKEIQDKKFQAYQAAQINQMEQYIHTRECRRKCILAHFEEEYEPDNCRQCDVCLSNRRAELNVSHEAVILFRLVGNLMASFGTSMLIKILRGSNDRKITPGMKKLEQYGQGKYKSEAWWKKTIRGLIVQGYLEETVLGGRYGGSVLGATEKSQSVVMREELGEKVQIRIAMN